MDKDLLEFTEIEAATENSADYPGQRQVRCFLRGYYIGAISEFADGWYPNDELQKHACIEPSGTLIGSKEQLEALDDGDIFSTFAEVPEHIARHYQTLGDDPTL